MHHYDVVIVGGGLVGAGLAAALSPLGFSIALVDARLPSNNDPRLFALNRTTCHFLQHINIWDALAPKATPVHQVHVSSRRHFGAVRLNKQDIQADALGYVIPARFIETELNQRLLDLPNVTLYQPATLISLMQNSEQATLTLRTDTNEIVLTAALVIGADGTASTVRETLGINTTTEDNAESAIVTITQLQRSHRNVAFEQFHANGAIAMLPLTDNKCATIWSADNKTIADLMALTDDIFVKTLQTAFGYRLGRLQHIEKRHHFPLRTVRANKAVEGRVLLLGNAAHTLHPIAAQGFNLALYEVATLVEELQDHWHSNDDAIESLLLKLHEKTKTQQKVSLGVSKQLSQLFSHPSAMQQIGLSLGMVGLDMLPPLKQKFINGMMGRLSHVPRLLMGINE